jgi:hypothetical protein
MLRYDALARHTRALRSLTGFDRDGFEALFVAYDAAGCRKTRGCGSPPSGPSSPGSAPGSP